MKRLLVIILTVVLLLNFGLVCHGADGYDSNCMESKIAFREYNFDATFPFNNSSIYHSTQHGIGFIPYVIDSAEDANDFLARHDIQYHNNGLVEHIKSLDSNFFHTKAFIVINADAPTLSHKYDITAVDVLEDEIVVYYEYTCDMIAADAIQQTHIVAEVNKAEIAGRSKLRTVVTDGTVFDEIDCEAYIFKGTVDEELLISYPDETAPADIVYGRHTKPFVIADKDELNTFKARIQSAEFESFAQGLADGFFDSKMIVAVASATPKAEPEYEFLRVQNTGFGLRLEFNIDASKGEKRTANHLVVAVIDNTYAEHSFSSWSYLVNVKGDIDQNGEIGARDYLLLKRGFFCTYNLTAEQQAAGDINKNGIIDARDYLLLKRAFFGTYVIE